MVHPETLQRRLALLHDMPAVVAGSVGIIVVHRNVHLGREHDAVALAVPLQRLSDGDLARAPAVRVRGVEEVDALIYGAVDDVGRVFFARSSPEHHAPETELADLHAGSSEVSVFHLSLLRGRRVPVQSRRIPRIPFTRAS